MSKEFIERMMDQFPELPGSRTLLAVSGGIDSMTMQHLFEAAGWAYGIAHCNFQLRGKDSEADHDLIKKTALLAGRTFHSIAFDTEQEAAERGISIQMAARELRYPWLELVRQEHGYDFIATAHHLNDTIETSLINQTRGTGLRGLAGIPARQGRLIRPMMAFTRREIKAYLDRYGISYREDSSNAKDEYHRNRIRHHVIPVLESINPSLSSTFARNLRIWNESAYLMEWACKELRRQYIREEGPGLVIDYQFASDHPAAAATLLFEWTRELGFHADQLQQALQSAGTAVGGIWESDTHRLLVDRQAFQIEPLRAEDPNDKKQLLAGNPPGSLEVGDGSFSMSVSDRPDNLLLSDSEFIAELDADKMHYPLHLRHWQEGDVFCPLGMNGKQKKLQDFFSDRKLSRFEKERVWLVENGAGHIVWIVGHRLDDRYKVDARTKRILKLVFQAKELG